MITADLLKNIPLFADIPDGELGTIAARAADIHLRTNDWLIQEGELPAFFILLSGRLTVSKLVGGIERVINTYGPGDYAGEVPLLLGSPAIASLRAAEPSRVCRLHENDFRELIAACPRLNQQLLRTMATRINGLQQLAVEAPLATVTIIGHRFDLACHALRDFLARNRVAYRWHDLRDPEARRGLPAAPHADEAYPVVLFPDGTRPSRRRSARWRERLGCRRRPMLVTTWRSSAPAGRPRRGGLWRVRRSADDPDRARSAGRTGRGRRHASRTTRLPDRRVGRRPAGALQQARIRTEIPSRATLSASRPTAPERAAVARRRRSHRYANDVIATASWRNLEVVGAEALHGRGVYYGAARTEAPSTRGRDIFLIGGGNSAGQAAMFFASYARTVTILVRGPSLAASMSHYLIAQLGTQTNIRVQPYRQVVALEGDDHLEAIVIEDRRTGLRRRETTDALFVFIGADAETSWLPSAVIRDERGYVCTGRDVMDLVASRHGTWPLARDPHLLETSVPGIFAAGDVRHGSIKRVAAGVGEGSMAIAFIHRYLAERATEKVAAQQDAATIEAALLVR
jgi:thioredoxin reductase (NADPH)